MCITETAAILQ